MNNVEINQVLAQACGVKFYINGDSLYYGDDDCVNTLNSGVIARLDVADVIRNCLSEFDYKDERCMAIIRNHFKMLIDENDGLWESYIPYEDLIGEGKTPHEADIACAEAIAASLEGK